MGVTGVAYRRLARPVLFRVGRGDAETVHRRTLRALSWISRSGRALAALSALHRAHPSPRTVFGVDFPSAVGLAAGMDKDGVALRAWPALGFGFVEVGTVTAHAQLGNPRPRLFRLTESESIINRMGFNNAGAAELAATLRAVGDIGVPLGISLGKSKVTPVESAIGDYLTSLRAVHQHADYIAVNVSSPNTPGLRQLQDRQPLDELLGALTAEAGSLAWSRHRASPYGESPSGHSPDRDPGHRGPRRGAPHRGGSHIAGSHSAGSRGGGSHLAGSSGPGSKGVGSQAAGSQGVGSHNAGSHNAGSHNAGSPRVGSHRAGPAAGGSQLSEAVPVPVLVKIAPDLTDRAIGELLEVCADRDVAGVIATNTTLDRRGVTAAETALAAEVGGLSGRPLARRALDVVRFVTAHSDLPVIGVGGISSAQDGLAMLDAGASLLQLYTGLVFSGPPLLTELNRAIAQRA
jgi:dihydroorotate dehydrogenase